MKLPALSSSYGTSMFKSKCYSGAVLREVSGTSSVLPASEPPISAAHSSAELRKAAHPLIASLTPADKLDARCFFSGDIAVPCLQISANKARSRHRYSRGRWPQAAVQSNANAAGRRGDFRRSAAKCVCPPFLLDIVSFPNPLMPKDDWIF